MADEPNAPALETVQAQLAAATAELANAKARIGELNRESQGHRLNGDNHRKAAEEAQAARDAALADAAKKLAEAEAAHAEKVRAAEEKAAQALTAAQQRAIKADLKIAAKDAGAHDIGAVLKLIDMAAVKTNEDGDALNAAELLTEFKKANPWAFGTGNSSSTATPPSPTSKPKTAAEMDDAEFAAAMRTKAWRK